MCFFSRKKRGQTLDVTIHNLILIFAKSKSLIHFVAKSFVKRIEYKYGHGGYECENEVIDHSYWKRIRKWIRYEIIKNKSDHEEKTR